MGLAENIRAKVHQGVLPPAMPVKIAVLLGDGRACSACDEPLLKAQTRYEFELPVRDLLSSTSAASGSGQPICAGEDR